MHLMLQHPEPDDYVVATGETHSVRDWCELAFAHVDLDYREYVARDQQFWRPAEAVPLVVDPTRARQELGWSVTRSFSDLVAIMVEAELRQPL